MLEGSTYLIGAQNGSKGEVVAVVVVVVGGGGSGGDDDDDDDLYSCLKELKKTIAGTNSSNEYILRKTNSSS
jgi:hypothetical protein